MNPIPTTPRVDALLSSFLEDSRKPGETALTVMAKRGLELTDLANALERELAEAHQLEKSQQEMITSLDAKCAELEQRLANEQTRCHMLDQEHGRWKFRAVEAEESLRGASAVAEGVVRVAVGLGLYDGTSPIKGDKIFDLVLAMKAEIEDGKLALGTMHRLFAEKDKALCASAAYAERRFADGLEAAANLIDTTPLERSADPEIADLDPEDKLFFHICDEFAKRIRALAKNQRQGADSPTHAESDVSAPSTPMPLAAGSSDERCVSVQSAPATPNAALTGQRIPEGWKLVPVVPSPSQWGGLGRDVFLWLDMTHAGSRNGPSLLEHLSHLGQTVPDWLAVECTKGHLSKGDRAAIVYRAMLDAAPEPPVVPRVVPCPNTAHMGEFACKDKSQCWEPCGELGNDDRHVRRAPPGASDAVDRALGIVRQPKGDSPPEEDKHE